jgi:phosphatidylserine/phosphatidylglycerophosphate/cardiolipin synthase-like enzyme
MSNTTKTETSKFKGLRQAAVGIVGVVATLAVLSWVFPGSGEAAAPKSAKEASTRITSDEETTFKAAPKKLEASDWRKKDLETPKPATALIPFVGYLPDAFELLQGKPPKVSSWALYTSDYAKLDEVIAKTIGYTKKGYTISIACYSFSNKKIIDALEKAHARGVRIEAQIDKSAYGGGPDSPPRRLEAISSVFRVYRGAGLHHHKMLLISQGKHMDVLFSGSFNFSEGATRNRENFITLVFESEQP